MKQREAHITCKGRMESDSVSLVYFRGGPTTDPIQWATGPDVSNYYFVVGSVAYVEN